MGVVVLALVGLIVFANRAHSVVRLGDGRIELVRGDLPGSLLGDLRDIARRLRPTGTVEIRGEGDALAVTTKGLDGQAAQRVRNVVLLHRNHIRRPR